MEDAYKDVLYSQFVWHYACNALPYTNIIFRDIHLTAVCINVKKKGTYMYVTTHIKFLQFPYPATPTGHKGTVDIQVENLTTTCIVWKYLCERMCVCSVCTCTCVQNDSRVTEQYYCTFFIVTKSLSQITNNDIHYVYDVSRNETS